MAFPNGAVGEVTLATITVRADAAGSSDLLLSATPGDLNEGFALETPVGSFDTDVTFGVGTVTVLPEPATVALLALGAAIAARRRTL